MSKITFGNIVFLSRRVVCQSTFTPNVRGTEMGLNNGFILYIKLHMMCANEKSISVSNVFFQIKYLRYINYV